MKLFKKIWSFLKYRILRRPLKVNIERVEVKAGTRRLKQDWSIDIEQDLTQMHHFDSQFQKDLITDLTSEKCAHVDAKLYNYEN